MISSTISFYTLFVLVLVNLHYLHTCSCFHQLKCIIQLYCVCVLLATVAAQSKMSETPINLFLKSGSFLKAVRDLDSCEIHRFQHRMFLPSVHTFSFLNELAESILKR